MSLVTSCPACGTAFLLKPEQLAPSRGDVRCGKCGQVFNALQSLTVAEAATPETPIEDDQSAAPPEVPVDTLPLEEPQTSSSFDIPPPPESEPTEPEPPAPAPAPEPERISVAVPTPEFKPTPVRAVRRSVNLRIPRWLLALLIVVLALAAIVQNVYYLRSEIAVRLPQTKPWLEQACVVIGCRVELPHKVQLLTIDDSDLQEQADHHDVFVLTTTIVNRADYPQAYPLLELTLTDIHDRAVMRRALQPREYLPQGTDLATGLAPAGEVHVKLQFTAPGIAATGYRVFVRYP